jgi:hypothetical protein
VLVQQLLARCGESINNVCGCCDAALDSKNQELHGRTDGPMCYAGRTSLSGMHECVNGRDPPLNIHLRAVRAS